jgi:hypothetical protein
VASIIIAVGLSILIGAALSLRFNVFALVPTAALALLGTAGIAVGHGSPIGPVAFVTVLLTAALPIGYFAGAIALAVVEESFQLENGANTYGAQNLDYERNSGKFKMLDIQECMEVVGSDGDHVGIVDHKESDCLVLSGDDPKAGGRPRLIWADWVDYVDNKIHLNKSSEKAVSKWQVAA